MKEKSFLSVKFGLLKLNIYLHKIKYEISDTPVWYPNYSSLYPKVPTLSL